MQELARSAIIGFVSGVLGALVVLWVSDPDEIPAQPAPQERPDQSEILARVAALEEQPVDVLQNADIMPGDAEPAAPLRVAEPFEGLSQADRVAEMMDRQRDRIGDQLRATGWSDSEIDSLKELQNAASLEMEQRMYEQMRQAVEENPAALSLFNQSTVFRDSLGEEKYEQYLTATGRPTAVTVNSLLAGSAGEDAGLKAGDIIRRCGADRVYDERDLMMSMLRGKPGEAVTIEVERDGAVFHISVPRGPLGTSQIGRMLIN